MASPSEVGGVLVVDKCAGATSHDVVAVARGALGTREIGHTGTLDPMATGVLVLVVGEATKLVTSLGGLEKRYQATLKLGQSTTTLDAEGEPDGSAPVPALSRAGVQEVAARFLGEHAQRAPLVSAIKSAGQPLYKRARKGQAVDAPLRQVRLDSVEVQAVRGDEIDLALQCGSGFYVRAFARDLAEALGTLGHLSALRRTHNGRFDLDGAVSFQELRAARGQPALQAALRARVKPLSEVCRSLPHVTLDAEGSAHARCGRPIPHAHAADLPGQPGTWVALDAAGEPVALVTSLLDHLRVVRGFRAR